MMPINLPPITIDRKQLDQIRSTDLLDVVLTFLVIGAVLQEGGGDPCGLITHFLRWSRPNPDGSITSSPPRSSAN